jgi:tetratricopeptide (TPR) repeat protein
MKCIYYNNLTSHLHNAGQYDEAEIWYAKTLQIYSDLPENRLKKRLSHAIESATADALFRKGEYREAISLLDRITPQSQRHRVGLALLYARCAIRLDDVETARTKLQFVLQHGNRLYCVEEAGRMIETLS